MSKDYTEDEAEDLDGEKKVKVEKLKVVTNLIVGPDVSGWNKNHSTITNLLYLPLYKEMIPESDKKYFRDVQDIDLTNDAGMIYFLNRKIMFGKIEKKWMKEVKRLFDKLDMEEQWKCYFTVYFQKYAVA